jgi:tripartite-type tricarboxylate transporter receptor subunit TctC
MLRKVSIGVLCMVTVMALVLAGCSSPAATASNTPAATAPAAEKFPTRPLELVVPYNAGSSVDINARAVSPSLERALNGKVMVTNKGGASGGIGANYVAKSAKPDGYTMGLANIASIVSTAALSDVGFDPLKDLKWIGCTATDTFLIGAASNSPFNSLKDVVEYLKKHPNGLKYAADGATSMDAMLAYNIESVAGVDINLVSFNGGGDVVTAVLGGHVDIYGGAYSATKSLIEAGKLKLLGVGGDKRMEQFPNVPTFAEQGYPMIFNMAKRSVYVPSATDPAVVAILQDALKKAVADPEYVEKCKMTGLMPTYLSPEECLQEAQTVSDWYAKNKEKILLGH